MTEHPIDSIIRVLRGQPSNSERYQEGMEGYWSQKIVEGTFPVATPCRFTVSYKLTCLFKRIDPHQFKHARMLDVGAPERILRELNEAMIRPRLRNFLVFAYGWANPFVYKGADLIHPVVWTFFKNEQERLRYDPNACEFIEWFNAQKPERGGCEIRLMLLDVDGTCHAAENYAMLNPDEIAKALQDKTYKRHYENVVVAALRYRTHVLRGQFNHTHEGAGYSIRTDMDQGHVRIQWQLKQSFPAGSRIIGVSEDSQLGSDVQATMRSGRRIVDTPDSGYVIDHLEPGQSRYYTFSIETGRRTSLNPLKPEYENHYDDAVRFTLRRDNPLDKAIALEHEATIQRLEQRLRGMNRGSGFDDKRQKIIENVEYRQNLIKLFDELRRKMVAEVDALHISETEKDRERGRWQSFIRQMMGDEGLAEYSLADED